MDPGIADIPRWNTALAEWGACLVYVLILARRWPTGPTVLAVVAGLGALLGIQSLAGSLPVALWIPGMLLGGAAMFAFIRTVSAVPSIVAGYVAARAFVLAELATSLHWQLAQFYLVDTADVWRTGSMVAVYAGVLGTSWLVERRHMTGEDRIEIGWRDLLVALALAGATFGISNLSFVDRTTPFSGRTFAEIFYIRTLVDLAGYVGLYVQHERIREAQLRRDTDAMSQLVRSQHEQYQIARRSIDEVNRKYHDMKHHLDAIREAPDLATRERVLGALEDTLRDDRARIHTGNQILDTVLIAKRMHAIEKDVALSVVANGQLLDFLPPLDLTAVVGNLLDNAVDAAARLTETDERLVRMAVYSQDDFVVVHVENSFDGVLNRKDGRIVTRKSGTGHGYGLRNIDAVVQSHGGSMVIDVDGSWFSLVLLFPRPGVHQDGP